MADKPMSEQMQKLAERYEKATGKKFGQEASHRCDGCRWFGVRHQKCSCCVRNIHMKDNYEKENN